VVQQLRQWEERSACSVETKLRGCSKTEEEARAIIDAVVRLFICGNREDMENAEEVRTPDDQSCSWLPPSECWAGHLAQVVGISHRQFRI